MTNTVTVINQPAPPENVREKISALEAAILKIPGTVYGDQPDCPLKHSFGDGIYAREIFTPAGKVIVTKIHKFAHPFFLLKGKCIVVTEEGQKLLEAPYYGMTPAGCKRALYIIEDVTWVTVHPVDILEDGTTETDLDKIEAKIIEKEFPVIQQNIVEQLEEG